MSVDLGELDAMAARARTKRQGVPPSRVGAKLKRPPHTANPAEEQAAQAPAQELQTPATVVTAAPGSDPQQAPSEALEQVGVLSRTSSETAAVLEPLVKTTMHIGATEDSFLDSVQFAGRSSRPKVDASRSAVVRLAVAQLAERMTPAEIVHVLASNASKSSDPGRKRR